MLFNLSGTKLYPAQFLLSKAHNLEGKVRPQYKLASEERWLRPRQAIEKRSLSDRDHLGKHPKETGMEIGL